ncbi:hypothetical protein EIM50_21030 [Pseudoxanthomonas sp. SGD-10]|nr:hypothetical protein EIM50_21030 [Pseudoxanthomonas sp. SGD-10]
MKILKALLFFLFLYAYAAKAQIQSPFFVDVTQSSQEKVFEHTLQLLFDSRYFIQSADKASGLIKCKTVVPDKRMFSSKNGDVLEFNLLIRAIHADTVRIHVQTNVIEKQRTGSVGNMGLYNNDLGVSSDPKYYRAILAFLKQRLTSN